MKEGEIVISLSQDEALVFFEWISHADEKNLFRFQHESEEKVVWKIEGQLEKKLTKPFEKEYLAQLEKARDKVQSQGIDPG